MNGLERKEWTGVTLPGGRKLCKKNLKGAAKNNCWPRNVLAALPPSHFAKSTVAEKGPDTNYY